MSVSAEVQAQFKEILATLRARRADIERIPGLVVARPGYDTRQGESTPALVLAFRPPHTSPREDLGLALGVPVVQIEATPEEQLRAEQYPGAPSDFERLFTQPPDFAPPRRGSYQPPSGPGAPRLKPVKDRMKLTVSASPDAGWPVLQEFLGTPARERMTVGMYQFTAPHIYEALRDNLRQGEAELLIGIHPRFEHIPESGIKANDLHGEVILQRLERHLGRRFSFDLASVGRGGAFTSAYHIKVAVADGARFWLSSGNWQSSNQPPFDPVEDPEALPPSFGSRYNREYHVVVEHPGLASTFEGFLDHDRTLQRDFAPAQPEPLPELFLPPYAHESVDFAPRVFHGPLRLEREVKVQPLLTPDNYAEQVLRVIEGARETLYLQNQYINLNPSGDLPEFRALVDALLGRIRAGLDVRIIVRSSMEPEKFDMLYALGFPARVFRIMGPCHAKLIVADGQQVVVGSHNWSNDGTITNRDASLLFDDEEVAKYLQGFFLEDWQRSRPARPQPQPRVARNGESPPSGMRRAPWGAWSEDVPAFAPAPPLPVAARAASQVAEARGEVGAPPGGGGVSFSLGAQQGEVVLNGIDARTGQYLQPALPLGTLAARIRAQGPGASGQEQEAARQRQGESFAPPFGSDPNDLKQSGWGVLYGPETPQAVKDKLAPLLAHRKARAGRFFHELTVQPGESVHQFLSRHGVSFGSVKPHRVPYHLLIVASPEEVPFEFQYLLDLDYSVGRLHFDDVEGYAAYAKAVVAYETGSASARRREVAYWGPRHSGDGATALSTRYLLEALKQGEPELGSIAERTGCAQQAALRAEATKDRLLQLLTGGASQPAVVFTAGHGMGLPAEDPKQRQVQGALLCGDWTGFGSISPAHYLAASDVPASADASGLIAFFFACFGLGTPLRDTFAASGQGNVIAPQPFISALPQRLLGDPQCPALAVIGHIDRAWGYSIQPMDAADSQLGPFEAFLGRVLKGECVGNGMTDLHGRAATLSFRLLDLLAPGASAGLSDAELVWLWLERNDARAYALLGDPAVRLR